MSDANEKADDETFTFDDIKTSNAHSIDLLTPF